MRCRYACLIIVLGLSNVILGVEQRQFVSVPKVEGEWWQVAGNPTDHKYATERQEPVDFSVWQAADGTWQLWSCMRKTKAGGEGGRTRFFYRWEGQEITDIEWQPMGIAMDADASIGETPGGLQAPHVVKVGDRYHMFYGDWVNICHAVSRDGKNFERVIQADGRTGMFSEGLEVNTRDIMMLAHGGKWYGYYTAHPNRQGMVFLRTTTDFKGWSNSRVVSFGGQAGTGLGSSECPQVVKLGPSEFYLFKTQTYGRYENEKIRKRGAPQTSIYYSNDPTMFGINQDDKYFVGTLAVAAPEVIDYRGQYYIAALNEGALDGIRIAKLVWEKKTKASEVETKISATTQLRNQVTVESLLEEMINRENPARVMEPAYVCRQFSSYDRDSVGSNQPGWFANWDRSQFVRAEENEGRREYVLMDAAGPGAVVRFWGTWHGASGQPFHNGAMRVYLDGASKPVIEGKIADIISGGQLVGEPLSKSLSPQTDPARRAHNLYFPIPYSKHCKITYESPNIEGVGGRTGEALYYQINYRTYEKGTQVESFSSAALQRARPVINRVQERLARSVRDERDDILKMDIAGALPINGAKSVRLSGPGAIRELAFKINADDVEQALRSTVLAIEFDGRRTVWCPVGDFMGTGHKLNPYRTWYTEVSQDGVMRCFWVMPFEKTVGVTIWNLGERVVSLERGDIRYSGWEWDDRSLYFHAAWRNYPAYTTGDDKTMDEGNAFDVNYVEIQGEGNFVGYVEYPDKGLPIEVRLEALSPFIPLNAADSALPATIMNFAVKNISRERVVVSLAGWLQNVVCRHSGVIYGNRLLRRNSIEKTKSGTSLLCSVKLLERKRQVRPPIVFEDFEGSDYGRWQVEGEAFGAGPAGGTLPRQQAVSGFKGKGLVNTFIDGDRPKGKLVSPVFKIEREYISFLIGGGGI